MTTPITPTSTSSASAATQVGSTTVDKNMFLKLLVAQMQNQDPMQPKDDSQWMGQMAQFSELEQISNVATSDTKIASSLNTSKALSLIGRQVTYTDASGASQQGTVDKVDVSGDTPTLDIGGQAGIDASA